MKYFSIESNEEDLKRMITSELASNTDIGIQQDTESRLKKLLEKITRRKNSK